MIRIKDNFLPKDLWDCAFAVLSQDRWVFPVESTPSHSRTKVWRMFDKHLLDELEAILVPYIGLWFELKGFAVKRVGVNGATPLIESHMHVDGPPGDVTLVWMANKEWHPLMGGELMIFHDEEAWRGEGDTKRPEQAAGASKIEFVPNRAVLFPSHLVHFPNSPHPRAAHRLRMTVGIHMRMI